MKPTCYLSRLNDCDGDIEQEHPIPLCLLKLNPDMVVPEIEGWNRRSFNKTAPILCKRHNNRLFGDLIDEVLCDFQLSMFKHPERKELVSAPIRIVAAGVLKECVGLAVTLEGPRKGLSTSMRNALIMSLQDEVQADYQLFATFGSSTFVNDNMCVSHAKTWGQNGRVFGFELRGPVVGLLVWFGPGHPLNFRKDYDVEGVMHITHDMCVPLPHGSTWYFPPDEQAPRWVRR